jgi:hypothetical protein
MTMAATTIPLAWLAGERPAVFGLLYAFNHCPADYLHPTRRDRFVAGGGEALWREARSRSRLSEFILREVDLLDRPWLDVVRPECPVALLDARRLLLLARCVGAASLWPRVRRSVLRDEVLRWKQRLTPAVYGFLMASAALLPGVAAPATDDDDAPVEATGFGWIRAALAAAPDELRLRVELKLPAEVPAVTADAAAAMHLVRSVHCALEPKWYSSFATLSS